MGKGSRGRDKGQGLQKLTEVFFCEAGVFEDMGQGGAFDGSVGRNRYFEHFLTEALLKADMTPALPNIRVTGEPNCLFGMSSCSRFRRDGLSRTFRRDPS